MLCDVCSSPLIDHELTHNYCFDCGEVTTTRCPSCDQWRCGFCQSASHYSSTPPSSTTASWTISEFSDDGETLFSSAAESGLAFRDDDRSLDDEESLSAHWIFHENDRGFVFRHRKSNFVLRSYNLSLTMPQGWTLYRDADFNFRRWCISDDGKLWFYIDPEDTAFL